MQLLQIVDASLRGRRETPAFEYTNGGAQHTLTFGELDARSDRMAQELMTRGIVPGDRLAVFLANCVEFIDIHLACLKLGVTMVPVNVLYREREIRHMLTDADPAAVVTSADLAAHVAGARAVWIAADLAAAAVVRPSRRPPRVLHSDAPAALVYTSGTTGESKGARLTQANFAANANALIALWEFTPADRLVCVVPLFHVHGLANALHCWLGSGCHMRLVERFDYRTIVPILEEYRPSVFFGVPTMYVRLLETDPARAREIGAQTRLFVSGSAPLPVRVLESFHERFGHTILERYGMTETLMNASNPYHGERRAGTVGRPLPGVTIRIVDEVGIDVPDGESGELVIHGANVCDGYWRRDEQTMAAFSQGWFRTGDIGVRSADGYITLNGRRTDLIISGGFNVYPREIEDALAEIEGIREAAVVGQPDARRGEIPVAYLVTDHDPDPVAIDAALRAQLASFKIPRAYARVDALPRTALGKVQRHLLPPITIAERA